MNGKSKSVSDRIKSIVSELNFDELVDQTEAKYNMKSRMDNRKTYYEIIYAVYSTMVQWYE